jgi:hypothetical protein
MPLIFLIPIFYFACIPFSYRIVLSKVRAKQLAAICKDRNSWGYDRAKLTMAGAAELWRKNYIAHNDTVSVRTKAHWAALLISVFLAPLAVVAVIAGTGYGLLKGWLKVIEAGIDSPAEREERIAIANPVKSTEVARTTTYDYRRGYGEVVYEGELI